MSDAPDRPTPASHPDTDERDETVGLDEAATLAATGSSTAGELPGPIGPYRPLRRIGAGGMGEVYLAEQTGAITRQVALKIIKQGMDTREVVARFKAERQALAMMDHPCIARAFDAGATDEGRPYFVMEYIDGLPITEYCDLHRLGTRERLALFVRVCDGVQHAHQKAIIHRDLKPSNVLVTLVDGQPCPKIIDFGIAKATGPAGTEQTSFTAHGQIVGTPEYMSPEQIELASEDIDTRTDIYSLGVILYLLLAGAPPFDPSDFRREGFEGMRRRILHQEPARPSTRVSALGAAATTSASARGLAPARLVVELKGDLDWITLKAIEKDRARRYATANGLAQDILRYLNDEPVLATPPSATYRFAKLVRRHRAAFGALAAILVILAASSVIATAMYFRAREEAVRSQQVATFMREMLSGAGPSVALGRDTKLLREILDKAAKRVEHDLAGQPLVEAEMRSVLASTYADLGEFDTAARHQQRAIDLLSARAGAGDVRTLKAVSGMGELQYSLGNFDAAESLNVYAGKRLTAALGPDDVLSLAAAAKVMSVYAYRGELDAADSIGRRVVPALRRIAGDASTDTRSAMFSLAGVYNDRFEFARAESLYLALVSAETATTGPEAPNTLTARIALGWAYRGHQRLPEAERETREALAIARRVLGNEHYQTQIAVNNLGIIYNDMNRIAEAEPLYVESYETSARVMGAKHPETLASLVNLATFHERLEHWAKSEPLADRAVRDFAGVVPDDFPGRGIALAVRGHCRLELGRAREALPDMLEADRILLPRFGPENIRTKELHARIKRAYTMLGMTAEAARW